ncbi:glycerate kinase [Portibacter lacus]|uniref:Glycerate kinase n=1 Tax=Portibacter lacus TaxID=1099794 RepID=A0AA37SLH5_9BACT|nr:glycerate kinase [Portibacter lacus]
MLPNLRKVGKFNTILLVPDSFKNSLSAEEVTEELAEGLDYYKEGLDIQQFPFADGGEGSLKVVERFVKCETRTIYTFDALMKPIRADYLVDPVRNIAYVEAALVVGLEVLDKDPDCYNASTYGLGLVIADALDFGVDEVYLFLGGTATCDGGVGMAAALGYHFMMEKRVLERPLARDVKYISNVRTENVHSRISDVKFHVACDVDNVLLGENGAVFTYAKQKGATEEQLELLELGMENIRKMLLDKKNIDVQDVPGTGAAGGLGAGSILFLDGQLKSAFDILSEIAGLRDKIKNADLVITGEGHIDMQSFNGKLISKIKEIADEFEKPVWLVCAIRSISEKEALKIGFERIHSLYKSMPKKINIPESKRKLFKVGKKWAEEWIEV